jgi:MFS family permease
MLEPSTDRALVRRYYWYRVTLSVGFITPVFTLFLLRDLTFTQFGALSALYSVLSVVGEVPTGYVGDRLGRRASLLLSVVFSVASLAGFVVVEGFLPYAVLYALWAVALTLRSGSADAWLYDILDERLDAGSFSHVRGRGDAVQRWAAAVTMVGGGFLYGVDPAYPFLAAVAFNSLGFLVLLSLPKNERYASRGDDGGPGPRDADVEGRDVDVEGRDADVEDPDADHPDRLGPMAALTLLRQQLLRPPLRSMVVYVGLFYATVSVANGYVQPMAVETLGPYAARFGVAVPEGGAVAAARSGEAGATLALALGVLYAVLSALSSVGGYYAGAIERRLGVRRSVLLVPAVTAVLLVVPLGLAVLALPVFVVLRTADPVVRPIASGYVNDHAADVGRATLLSTVSMLTMTVRVPLALGAGVVADGSTATAAVGALGALFLATGGLTWLFGDVVPDGSAADAGAAGD